MRVPCMVVGRRCSVVGGSAGIVVVVFIRVCMWGGARGVRWAVRGVVAMGRICGRMVVGSGVGLMCGTVCTVVIVRGMRRREVRIVGVKMR